MVCDGVLLANEKEKKVTRKREYRRLQEKTTETEMTRDVCWTYETRIK